MLTGSQEGWWATELGAKDAGLATDIARAAHVELPEATAVKSLYEQAAASGMEHADAAVVARLYG